jgi:S1-C subfamily serine protease
MIKKKKKTKKITRLKKLAIISLILGILFIGYGGIFKPVVSFVQHANYDASIVKLDNVTDGSHGTGFFIEYNDTTYLVTAAHVCGTESFLVSRYGSHVVVVLAPEYDTCILEAQTGMKTLKLAEKVKEGMKVSITGFPLEFEFRKTSGVVNERSITQLILPLSMYGFCPKNSVPYGEGYCMIFLNTYETTAQINGGNSGGPVIMDNDGKVVGLISAMDRRTGMGYFIPVQDVRKVLKEGIRKQ